MSNEESIEHWQSGGKTDWVLEKLIALANRGIGIIVTLNVGGFLISGRVTSEGQYFEGISKSLKSGLEASKIEGPFTELDGIFNWGADAIEGSVQEAVFIHLEDARIFHPAGLPIPADRGELWRGRLDSIDGFTFASLGARLTRVRQEDLQ